MLTHFAFVKYVAVNSWCCCPSWGEKHLGHHLRRLRQGQGVIPQGSTREDYDWLVCPFISWDVCEVTTLGLLSPLFVPSL